VNTDRGKQVVRDKQINLFANLPDSVPHEQSPETEWDAFII